MKDIIDKIDILVVSCDKYSDLWLPFFKLFWKFWPDCPFDVYLLSNKISVNIPRVQSLLVGQDISWSDNLHKALSQLKKDYIFLFLDDLFLYDTVKTSEVLKIFDWAIKSNINYLRMNPSPKPDKPCNELVGYVSKGTIYRTSTVLSLWRKNVLLDLLIPGESAWDFEINGSIRSDKYDRFYSTWKSYFPVINGVIRGKWRRSMVKKLKYLGIEVNLNKREVMNISETMILYLKFLRSNALKLFPPKYRRRIREFFLKRNSLFQI
jgi:hypothetical protein